MLDWASGLVGNCPPSLFMAELDNRFLKELAQTALGKWCFSMAAPSAAGGDCCCHW